MKGGKKAFVVGVVLCLALVIRLVYAAFSGTKRDLGSESRLEDATATGGVQIGKSGTDGSLYFKPHDNPGTCDSTNEGALYADDSDNCMSMCNGTAWTSLCQ